MKSVRAAWQVRSRSDFQGGSFGIESPPRFGSLCGCVRRDGWIARGYFGWTSWDPYFSATAT